MKEPDWSRLRRILRPNERKEVSDEIAFHIQMRTAELIEQGVDPSRAREMAEHRFGPVQLIQSALVDNVRRRRKREDRAEAFMSMPRTSGSQFVRFAALLVSRYRQSLRLRWASGRPWPCLYVPARRAARVDPKTALAGD